MLNRWVEDDGLVDTLEDLGIGSIVFSPLAQGMLTTKYLSGIPEDSRAAQNHFLKRDFIRPSIIDNIRKLNEIAEKRGQTLAQMAIAWVLRGNRITSALIGASRSSQIVDCVKALDNLEFTPEELKEIDVYAREADINLWAKSAERE
jgi:L-glyceraldehyde 3-phosphate reductase